MNLYYYLQKDSKLVSWSILQKTFFWNVMVNHDGIFDRCDRFNIIRILFVFSKSMALHMILEFMTHCLCKYIKLTVYSICQTVKLSDPLKEKVTPESIFFCHHQ